jgi:cell wall-associated NlpC family hydrolase
VTTRRDVVDAARTWIGVRWKHQGRSRDGIDCVGLVVCINRDLFGSTFNVTGYSSTSIDETMIEQSDILLHRIPVRSVQFGDVVVVGFAKQRHMAVIGDYPHGGHSLIHAYLLSRRVIENRLDPVWQSRILAAYKFPEVV